jgi:hypothetical protein
MDTSTQLAWASVAILILFVIALILGALTAKRSAPVGIISLGLLFVVLLSFTMGIGYVLNTQVFSEDAKTQRAGIQACIGQIWPLVIMSLLLMSVVIRKYGITADSLFYFFASFLILFFCTLMLEVVYVNKAYELNDPAFTIDTTQTNVLWGALTVVIVGSAITAIIF